MNREKLGEFWLLLRRRPFCSVCAAVSLLLAAAAAYIRHDSSALVEERDASAHTVQTMLDTLLTGPMLRQELASAKEYTQRIEDNLADERELPESLSYFQEIEKQTRARIVMEPLGGGAPDSGSLYKRLSFHLTVSGSFAQVRAALYNLENGKRLANISSFTLRRQQTAGDVNLSLNLEFLGKL